MTKYFKEQEFERCIPSCKITDVSPDSLARLDRAREIAGVPFVINSAYRSPGWDIAHGRSGRGAHTCGRAFDIRCTSASDRWKMVVGLLAAGFTRLGISRTFIHADDDADLSHPIIWTY